MRAAILSIGSELMHGFLTDTNATFLTQEMSALGIEPLGVMQVGDDLDRIIIAFRRALEDAELVVATGGIGPTEDDLTREAIAAVRGEQVQVQEDLVERIRAFFAARGLAMPEQNVKQAWMIPSGETLDNPMGTAPGWFVRHGGQIMVAMPGVPREMRRMWSEQAVPRILPRLSGSKIVSRTLKTIGIGESAAEQAILDIVHRRFPTVATYAKNDGVHVRITAISNDLAAARDAVDAAERDIHSRIGQYIYGTLDDSLASAIVSPLIHLQQQIAIWEVGTAARLANLLQDDPLADSAVAQARSTCWQVAVRETGRSGDPAAVAAACARYAAEEAGVPYGASIAVDIVEGDTPDRATARVGLAVSHPAGVITRSHTVSAIAPEIRRRATLWSSDFLRTAIREATALRQD